MLLSGSRGRSSKCRRGMLGFFMTATKIGWIPSKKEIEIVLVHTKPCLSFV